ncbi:MAG TPA: recombinase family protein [Planctomycetota bacterium]|nr:recombinase family protein [Planctomycetota bacterium]
MNLIAYHRVSTKQQGQSGLGLEAQKTAVEAYAKAAGAPIQAVYTEVESGKRADRPKLAAAIAHARRSKAKLVIAKLDRLARNVAFLSKLMDSGCDFVACDNPNANRLTIHILAAVAEDEARRISERTKAALAAAKARGAALGSNRPGHWQGREDARLAGLAKGREASIEARRAMALAAVADLAPTMQELRAKGESLAAIAEHMNTAGQQTARGSKWTAMSVKRVLDRQE